MILIIGNKGSFSEECLLFVRRSFENVLLIYTSSIDYSSYTNCSISLLSILKGEDEVKILYIGGETKVDNQMCLHNLEIPLLLSKFCKLNNFQFVLLGSLSQWGLINWNNKSDIYENSPLRTPYDEYSKTKQLCYLKINSSEEFIGYFICPASILNHKHKSGSIYVIRNFMKFKLIRILFQFKGMISYCERSDVYEAITKALSSNVINNNVIVSKSIPAIHFSSTKRNKWKLNYTYFIGYILYHLFYFINLKKFSQKVVLLFTEINFISMNNYLL
jgi:hypothetical protein